MLLENEKIDDFATKYKRLYGDVVSQVKIFNNDTGKMDPHQPTISQWAIIGSILEEPYNRVQVICPTQYGKSLNVGVACLISAVLLGDRIAIIAPSTDKAKIIMDVVIDHLDDSPIFSEAVKLDGGETIERIKRYRQKTRLSFSGGGELRVYSADSRNKQATTKALMGFGSRKIIVDESSIIDDELYSTVKRMVGGYKDGFMFEIGNPWENNHFRRTWESERYLRIFVDYQKALAEGRYNAKFIEEMKEEEHFSVLYECKFPDTESTGVSGQYKLLSPYLHLNGTTTKYNIEPNSVLGVDVARAGRDHTVIVKRGSNYCRVVWRSQKAKIDEIAMMVVRFIKGGVQAENVFIDEVGVGGMLVDFLNERGYNVVGVNGNAKPSDRDRYYNLRAEMFWEMKIWLEKMLEDKRKPLVGKASTWKELSYLTYSFLNGKIKMTLKEEIKAKMKGESPDIADALAMTFAYERDILIPEKPKSITETIFENDMKNIRAQREAEQEEKWTYI